jgi:hypothetical protein
MLATPSLCSLNHTAAPTFISAVCGRATDRRRPVKLDVAVVNKITRRAVVVRRLAVQLSHQPQQRPQNGLALAGLDHGGVDGVKPVAQAVCRHQRQDTRLCAAAQERGRARDLVPARGGRG